MKAASIFGLLAIGIVLGASADGTLIQDLGNGIALTMPAIPSGSPEPKPPVIYLPYPDAWNRLKPGRPVR